MGEQPEGTAVSRRAVLAATGAVGAAGVLAACGGGSATPTSSSAAPTTGAAPSSSAAVDGEVLAALSDIPVGGGAVFDGPKVVVTQPAAGTIHGFTAVCPHQGCLVSEVTATEIICPCHDSRFSAEDGSVISGPATQGLAVAAVSVQGDEVVLA